MQAVILAAGQSHRFYPFTSLAHKSMVTLMGKTLLDTTLESLQKAGISEVIIVVGKESPIPDLLSQVKELSVRVVVQEEALGMGHALLQATPYLAEKFFLLSGYHLDFPDFSKDMQEAQKDETSVVLLAKEDTLLDRYGVIDTEGERVVNLVERPEKTQGKGLRVIGIYLLNKIFLKTLEKTPLEHYHFEKALSSYAKEGYMTFVKTDREAITLKYSWDLLSVKDYLLKQTKRFISEKASIAKNVVIEGDVYISDGVTIYEGACIKGPCFLGENVVVGNNAILRGGVIAEKNVVIGASMEVKNSILMTGVTTHTGFIGDSIIGSLARIAAGFCTANVRLDRAQVKVSVHGLEANTGRVHMGIVTGEYVDMGVGVTTMPGIIVGSHVTVGPATVLMENVEDNVLLYTKFETVKKQKKHE